MLMEILQARHSKTETRGVLFGKSGHRIAAFAPGFEAAFERPDAGDAVAT
jgi:hypothetical protein